MTKKQTVYWNSPGDIEVFIPIIEKQLPNISVEKKGTLAEFIEATQGGAMGILIYPEQSARENHLWPQLSKLTKHNLGLIVFEDDAHCESGLVRGNINTPATPLPIITAIHSRLADLTK